MTNTTKDTNILFYDYPNEFLAYHDTLKLNNKERLLETFNTRGPIKTYSEYLKNKQKYKTFQNIPENFQYPQLQTLTKQLDTITKELNNFPQNKITEKRFLELCRLAINIISTNAKEYEKRTTNI